MLKVRLDLSFGIRGLYCASVSEAFSGVNFVNTCLRLGSSLKRQLVLESSIVIMVPLASFSRLLVSKNKLSAPKGEK